MQLQECLSLCCSQPVRMSPEGIVILLLTEGHTLAMTSFLASSSFEVLKLLLILVFFSSHHQENHPTGPFLLIFGVARRCVLKPSWMICSHLTSPTSRTSGLSSTNLSNFGDKLCCSLVFCYQTHGIAYEG